MSDVSDCESIASEVEDLEPELNDKEYDELCANESEEEFDTFTVDDYTAKNGKCFLVSIHSNS